MYTTASCLETIKECHVFNDKIDMMSRASLCRLAIAKQSQREKKAALLLQLPAHTTSTATFVTCMRIIADPKA